MSRWQTSTSHYVHNRPRRQWHWGRRQKTPVHTLLTAATHTLTNKRPWQRKSQKKSLPGLVRAYIRITKMSRDELRKSYKMLTRIYQVPPVSETIELMKTWWSWPRAWKYGLFTSRRQSPPSSATRQTIFLRPCFITIPRPQPFEVEL